MGINVEVDVVGLSHVPSVAGGTAAVQAQFTTYLQSSSLFSYTQVQVSDLFTSLHATSITNSNRMNFSIDLFIIY